MLVRMWRKNTSPVLVGFQAGTTTLEINLGIFRQLEIVLLKDPSIQLVSIYPKDAPTYYKDICFTMFIAALFIIARSWKEPRCPSIEEWIQKMWYIYTTTQLS